MVSLELIWFFLKRTSKFLSFIFAFIAFILLIFLQLSCSTPLQSKNYALELKLNNNSSIFPLLNTTFNGDETTQGFADLEFRVGISGLCIGNLPVTINTPFNSIIQCYKSNKNFSEILLGQSNLYDSMNIQILNTNNEVAANNFTSCKTELNLLDLSKHLAKTIHPAITTTSLAIQSISLLTIILTLLPKPWNLPFIQTTPAFISYIVVNVLSLIISGINTIFLNQVSDPSYSTILSKLSLNIIVAKNGGPCQKINYLSLLFQFLQLCCITVSFIRFFYNMNEEVDELKEFSYKNKNIKTINSSNKDNFGTGCFSSYSNPFGDNIDNDPPHTSKENFDSYKASSNESSNTKVQGKNYSDSFYFKI